MHSPLAKQTLSQSEKREGREEADGTAARWNMSHTVYFRAMWALRLIIPATRVALVFTATVTYGYLFSMVSGHFHAKKVSRLISVLFRCWRGIWTTGGKSSRTMLELTIHGRVGLVESFYCLGPPNPVKGACLSSEQPRLLFSRVQRTVSQFCQKLMQKAREKWTGLLFPIWWVDFCVKRGWVNG